MDRASRRFLYGSVISALAAAAEWMAPRFGFRNDADWVHFAAVGIGAFALGFVLVRAHPQLAPDPDQRKGVAPRAFWTLLLGVALRGGFGAADSATRSFPATLSLTGVLLESAALAMLIYGAIRAPAKLAPPRETPPAIPPP